MPAAESVRVRHAERRISHPTHPAAAAMTDPIGSEPGEAEAIPDPVATRGIPHTTHDARF